MTRHCCVCSRPLSPQGTKAGRATCRAPDCVREFDTRRRTIAPARVDLPSGVMEDFMVSDHPGSRGTEQQWKR